MPSSRLEVNSRGESILYFRNSGERQVSFFFDGALLNVPWDNRLDAQSIATEVIGKMQIAKGSSSILYGPNTIGGAVSINTFERVGEGQTNILRMQGMDGGGYFLSGTSHNRTGNSNLIVNFSRLGQAGNIISNPPDYTVYNQGEGSSLQTNSDISRTSGYIRAETELGDWKLGVGLLAFDGEKGVIPQNHRRQRTRFWRYSRYSRIMAIGNAMYEGGWFDMRNTIWVDGFRQDISKYESIDYESRESLQRDKDDTYGIRSIWDSDLWGGMLSISGLGYLSKHSEKESGTTSDFAQTTWSLGSEYRKTYEEFSFAAGASFDGTGIIEAGEFDGSEGKVINDWSALLGLGYDLESYGSLFANISRKTRFPTLREQFATVDRFVVNPELAPETAILSELGYSYRGDGLEMNITGFVSLVDGVIETVQIDTSGLEMRVNLDEATIYGVEVDGGADFNDWASLLYNSTYSQSTGTVNGVSQELESRPDLSGFFRLMLEPIPSLDGFTFQPELQYDAWQFSRNAIGELEEIGFQYAMNLRLAYKFITGSDNPSVFEAFARVDNITNEKYLYKIGFARPGRTFVAGVSAIL
ncbi:MAG: hypothetical protein Kapaf2KO_12480 [Candidatus Kapaibacteriales bacterium]